MKVVNVDLVENEMVEMNVAQIGSNWGWIEVECGDESEFGSGECGDKGRVGYAEKINPAAIPLPPPHPSLHPIPNQSKPIVPTPSYPPLITFSYIFITISYNH